MLARMLFMPNSFYKACSLSILFPHSELLTLQTNKKCPLCCCVSLTPAAYFSIYFSRWTNVCSRCTIVVQNRHVPVQSHRCCYVAKKNMNALLCSKHISFHLNSALFPLEALCIDMPILPLCRIDNNIFFFVTRSIPRYIKPETWN